MEGAAAKSHRVLYRASAKGTRVAKKELNIVKALLFWSYANLAMAHTTVDKKQKKYAAFN